jgi:chromosome segregation ATPase
MIEPIMYFGIGFLIASLFGLVFIPLVHNRAVRLTMRRLEATTPLSMAEIQADKDQLRAEFAMSTRRLELTIEQLKAKTTSQLAELGKKTGSINRLKVELGEKTATILSLEAREKGLKEQLRATEGDFATKTRTLHDAEQVLADKQAELARLAAELDERSVVADSQRVEMVAMRTQVDALLVQIEDHEHEAKEAQARLNRARQDTEAAARQLADERQKGEALGARLQEFEARVGEQSRALAQRHQECEQLRAALAEQESRAADGSGEREENALLRERMNEIAAEVARLTVALEGPDSPIEAILADDAAHAHTRRNGGSHHADKADAETAGSSLADRIRALQTRVAGIATPS